MGKDSDHVVAGARLGHRVSIKALRGHPRFKWRGTYIESGKYRQKYFKIKADAERWKEEREDEALESGVADHLTKEERSAVVENRDKLAKLGLRLRQVISDAIKRAEKQQELKAASVEEVLSMLIASRERSGRSERYVRSLRSRLGRFSKEFGERQISTLRSEELSDWIYGLGLGAETVNSYRRELGVLFSFAEKRGFVVGGNPAKGVEGMSTAGSEVGIVTPAEAAALLGGADRKIVPAIAIALFAGIRDAELKRLDWAQVRFRTEGGSIKVLAKNAKSARQRTIKMSQNLREWLAPYAGWCGNVWPRNGRKLMDAARRAAGFGNPGSETDEEKARGITLKPWPNNAARHSFASFHIAHHRDAKSLALDMGHATPGIVFGHYREEDVEPEEAEKYWVIFPEEGAGEKVIVMEKTA